MEVSPPIEAASKRLLCLLVACLLRTTSSAQLPDLSSLPNLPHAEVDSSFLQVQETGWSIRFYGTYKLQGILLVNQSSNRRLLYAPIALYSVGVGATYKFLTVDFGFNPVPVGDVDNSRFGMVASLTLPQSLLDFSLQRYRGYRLRNHRINNRARSDISNFSLSLQHLHLFNLTRVNILKIMQGGNEVKRGGGSLGIGGFFDYHRVKADLTLVPPIFEGDFNDEGRLQSTRLIQLGALLGFTQVVRLPQSFFLLFSAAPGFGFNFGKMEAEDLSYRPSIWALKLSGRSAIGYSGKRHYYLLSLTFNGNYTDAGPKNNYAFTTGQVKFVIGYRIRKSIRQIDKILGDG